MINIKVRPANLIDVLRLLGSFGIVWFHSSFYAYLSNQNHWSVIAFHATSAWIIPFFYMVSAYFAVNPGDKHSLYRSRGKRILKIFSLVLIMGLLHEIFRMTASKLGLNPIDSLFEKHMSLNRLLVNLTEFLQTGNRTPLYFLYNIAVLTGWGFVVTKLIDLLGERLVLIVSTCLLTLVLSNRDLQMSDQLSQFLMFTRIEALVAGLVGFVVALSRTQFKMISLPRALLLMAMTVALGIPGIVTVFFGKKVWIYYLSLVPMSVLILVSRRLILSHPLLVRLSRWGQQYALGVFLWHPFTTSILDVVIKRLDLVSLVGELGGWILVSVLGFGITLVVTKYCYRYFPVLVKI